MQVILLKQVRNLGNIGDTVKVRDGYGRNYLIPHKYALRATKENVAYFEARRAEIQKENADLLTKAQGVADSLKGLMVTIVQQAGEDGRLYGSVKTQDIAKAFETQHGKAVDRKQVEVRSAIKYIGIYTIHILLHADVTVEANVNVARSEDEAKDAAERFARGEKVMEGSNKRDEDEEEAFVAPAPAVEGEAEATEEGEGKKAKKKAKKAEAAEGEEAPAEEAAEGKKKKAAKK